MSTDGYRVGRKLHLVIGLIGALWLIFMSVTGVLINHQDWLGLGDKEVSDRFLPDSYRADVRTGTTRLNVVITDLHSGRFFGKYGGWLSDVMAVLLVLSVLSGVYMYFFSKYVKTYSAQSEATPVRMRRVGASRNRKPHRLDKAPHADPEAPVLINRR